MYNNSITFNNFQLSYLNNDGKMISIGTNSNGTFGDGTTEIKRRVEAKFEKDVTLKYIHLNKDSNANKNRILAVDNKNKIYLTGNNPVTNSNINEFKELTFNGKLIIQIESCLDTICVLDIEGNLYLIGKNILTEDGKVLNEFTKIELPFKLRRFSLGKSIIMLIDQSNQLYSINKKGITEEWKEVSSTEFRDIQINENDTIVGLSNKGHIYFKGDNTNNILGCNDDFIKVFYFIFFKQFKQIILTNNRLYLLDEEGTLFYIDNSESEKLNLINYDEKLSKKIKFALCNENTVITFSDEVNMKGLNTLSDSNKVKISENLPESLQESTVVEDLGIEYFKLDIVISNDELFIGNNIDLEYIVNNMTSDSIKIKADLVNEKKSVIRNITDKNLNKKKVFKLVEG